MIRNFQKFKLLPVFLLVALGVFVFSAQGAQAWSITDIAAGAITSLLNWVLYAIVQTLGWLLGLVGKLANYALQPDGSIIRAEIVTMGWGIARDFANMFFILILLGIALDFILFNSFKVKQMIPRLLLIALLINFSLPIAGVVLDFANIFTQFFIGKMTTPQSGVTEGIAQSLNLAYLFTIENVREANGGGDASNTLFLNMVFAIIFMFGTFFIFLAMALMFFIRTGYLYILLTILPIVLVLYAFPPTSGYFGKWSNKFISWTMFAPVATFFIYLAATYFNSEANQGFLQILRDQNVNNLQQMYSFVIAWVFLGGSLVVGQQMGIHLGKISMDSAKTMNKWTRGKLSQYGKRGVEHAGGAWALEKGAEFAAKHPLATLGMGGFAARIAGGAAANIRAAKREAAELSKGEKDMVETGSPEQVTAMIEAYSKGTPDQRAKAAKMIPLAEKKDKLKVKRGGIVDHKATRELKKGLRKKAKDIGDFAAAKAIDQSDFVIGKEAINEKYKFNIENNKFTVPENTIDPDSGKTIKEARERKLADLYRKINLATEDWDDSVVEDDPEFIPDMVKYGVLTAEKFKQAQRSGNTQIIKQFREYMTKPAYDRHREEHLASEENAAFRNWLRSTPASGIVGNYKEQLKKMGGEEEVRKQTADAIRKSRKEAGKEEKNEKKEKTTLYDQFERPIK